MSHLKIGFLVVVFLLLSCTESKRTTKSFAIREFDLSNIDYFVNHEYTGVHRFFVDSVPDLNRIDKFACNFHDSITEKYGFDTLIYYNFYRESDKLNIEFLRKDPKSIIDNIHSENSDLYAVYKHRSLNCKLYRQLYEFSPNSKFSVLECDFCE